MGFLGTGWTILASLQKSGGRSASSGGDDRWIARSLIRRSRARSARPRAGRSLLLEDLEVRLALTSVAHAGRDDATDNHAGLSPVGVDHGERESLGQPDGNDPPLAVVPTRVLALQRGTLEDERGELEVEATLSEIASTLSAVPAEAHRSRIRMYIQRRKRRLGWERPNGLALSCRPPVNVPR